MGKITKLQTKAHETALELLSLDRALNLEEVEEVYRNYNPLAEHNVGKGAIFFTPYNLAWEFAVMSQPKGTVLDLGAGIGVLAHQVLKHDYAGWSGGPLRGEIKRMICIEHNPTFVEIGKKLIPEAEWHCANFLDLDLLTSLGKVDCVISNPPYGMIPSSKQYDWTKVKGPIQWKAVEIACRISWGGGMFILPSIDCDHRYSYEEWIRTPDGKREHRSTGMQVSHRKDTNRAKYLDPHFPGTHMSLVATETEIYEDEWIGAKPDVVIVDLSLDDVEWQRPYGFADVARLVNVPKVERKPKDKPLPKHVDQPGGVQLGMLGD